jgi:hypothetical protein
MREPRRRFLHIPRLTGLLRSKNKEMVLCLKSRTKCVSLCSVFSGELLSSICVPLEPMRTFTHTCVGERAKKKKVRRQSPTAATVRSKV